MNSNKNERASIENNISDELFTSIEKKNKNSKNIKSKKTTKSEKRRKEGIKNTLQYFIYFLTFAFCILVIFYILGLIFPCIREMIDMITIEKIIYSVFSLFIGGIFGDHLKKYLKNEKEQKKN